MKKLSSGRLLLCAALFLALAACSPTYDWREVYGADPAFTAAFPAKPAIETRSIDLAGTQVAMTMTSASVSGNVFAVGSARLASEADVPAALNAMKAALLKNIGGKIISEKSSGGSMIEIEAIGSLASGNGNQPRFLAARFVAEGGRIYQVVAMGRKESLPREAIDTFLTSFKPA